MADRPTGVLLFLPVPVVLWLFTRQPLGVWASLGLGVAVMVSHRTYARPWAMARAGRRCLWCGRGTGQGPVVELAEPFGDTDWSTCGAGHASAARRVMAWADAHRPLLKAGILGALAVFLVATPAAARGLLPGVVTQDVADAFRLSVAVSVLPLAFLAPRAPEPPRGRLRVPFPVHIQALIGTAAVLWLFRLVGLAWLGLSAWSLSARWIR